MLFKAIAGYLDRHTPISHASVVLPIVPLFSKSTLHLDTCDEQLHIDEESITSVQVWMQCSLI